MIKGFVLVGILILFDPALGSTILWEWGSLDPDSISSVAGWGEDEEAFPAAPGTTVLLSMIGTTSATGKAASLASRPMGTATALVVSAFGRGGADGSGSSHTSSSADPCSLPPLLLLGRGSPLGISSGGSCAEICIGTSHVSPVATSLEEAAVTFFFCVTSGVGATSVSLDPA